MRTHTATAKFAFKTVDGILLSWR